MISLIPVNLTVQVPRPPDRVVTITSPFPMAGPDTQMILFGDTHSAERVQSRLHIITPNKNSNLLGNNYTI